MPRLSVFIFILMPFLPSAVMASPCKNLLNLEGEAKSTKTYLAMMDVFYAPLAEDPAKPVELFYTKRSNFFTQPNCNTNGKVSRTNGLFYPAGVVVRKLGSEALGRKTLELVETEYGLRTFIDNKFLAPLRDDTVYFFANSHDIPRYCPRSKPDCDLTLQKNRELHPKIRHARAPRAAIDGEILIDGVSQCQTVNVDIYDYKKSNKSLKKVDRGALPLCIPVPGEPPGIDRRIKVVTLATYRKLFETKIYGSFARINASLMSKLLDKSLTFKDCGVDKLSEISMKVRGQEKTGFKLFFLELSQEGVAEYVWKEVDHQGSSEKYIHYSTYSIKMGNHAFDGNSLPVQAIFTCDTPKIDPDVPKKLALIDPLDRNNDFSVRIDAVKTTFKKVDKDVSLPGPSLSTDHKMFRRGQMWKIRDHTRFFVMRDALADLLRDDHNEQINNLLDEDEENPVARARLVGLLSHLMLLSSSDF